jgi:beta-lactamase superfamily II metal-dependent hydrolase
MAKKNNSSLKNIRIRMYRVGFGDCFLMSLPSKDGPKHILIDCGVHAKGDIQTMEKVVDNLASTTDRKLAIVIASHAHQDHISAFGKFTDEFRKFQVEEVWLPWTDNPDDPEAVKLGKKQAELAAAIKKHFDAKPAATPLRSIAVEALANLTGNERAMQLLRSGFDSNAKVRYMSVGEKLSVEPIPGLNATILGPPHDQKFLAKMNPLAGEGYLRLAEKDTSGEAFSPFAAKWKANKADLPKLILLSSEDEKFLTKLLTEDLSEQLALTLDSVRNNTSLVVLFSYKGKHFLFPGDAQFGNWESWLSQSNAQDILSSVNFLKVAHHGSHNATPKKALESMTGNLTAMVSTQNTPWSSIPRMPLMERLMEICEKRVIRSDSLSIPQAPSGPVLKKLPEGFVRGDFWFDYELEV